jgi:hypothetical protein
MILVMFEVPMMNRISHLTGETYGVCPHPYHLTQYSSDRNGAVKRPPSPDDVKDSRCVVASQFLRELLVLFPDREVQVFCDTIPPTVIARLPIRWHSGTAGRKIT